MNTIEEQIREFARALDRTPARPTSNHSAPNRLWRPGPRLVGTLAAGTLAVGGLVAVGVAMTSTGGSPAPANYAAPIATASITTASCPRAVMTVPPLVGLTEADAVSILVRAGLVPTVVHDQSVAGDGRVTSQVPASLVVVGRATAVEIHVAVAAEPLDATTTTLLTGGPTTTAGTCPAGAVLAPGDVVVPALYGLSRVDAEAALGRLGLVAGVSFVDVSQDATTAGVVAEQGTPYNDIVRTGSTVSIVIGRPVEGELQATTTTLPAKEIPAEATVPSLTGLTEQTAVDLLDEAGLRASITERVVADGDTTDGAVVEQLIQPGTVVPGGSLIGIVVARSQPGQG
jgi:beta-lactam-binding protein with PASTA domain